MSDESFILRVESLEKEVIIMRGALGLSPDEIAKYKARVDELLKQTEDAQRRADGEALRANNAKLACEEHSKTISQKKGQVDVDSASVAQSKAAIDAVAAKVTTLLAEGESGLKQIEANKLEAAQGAQKTTEFRQKSEIESKSISDNKQLVDTAIIELKAVVVDAKAELDLLKGINKTAQAELVVLQQAAAAASKQKNDVDAHLVSVSESVEKSSAYVLEMASITSELKSSEKRSKTYEEDLLKCIAGYEELVNRVEGVLPGATTASLASSFRDQALRFRKPQRNWLICFMVSIGLLMVIAIPSFIAHLKDGGSLAWGTVALEFVHKLPLTIPLVWLALYSGRNYMTSVRVEEDYAYKEALSRAFEGYRKQMAEIVAGAGSETPLNVLCTNVLRAISERPGRIYEGAHHDITPASSVVDAVGKMRTPKVSE
jgi:hypothetical protein